jgi:aspartyl-tRNA(Asn)/glutamyl-tRNA(Gln) amidotransferase subunit B
LGRRTETKNVNSLRAIEQAVHHEIERQAGRLAAGLPVTQETRHFHADTGATTPGRSKEEAEDYRYFPEPDLLPVVPDRAWIAELRTTLPESPAARRRRLQTAWGFSDLEFRDAVGVGALDLIEATVAAGATPAGARKWWTGVLARLANERATDLAALPITPAEVAQLEGLVRSGKLTDSLARQALAGTLEGKGSPAEVADALGLTVVADDDALGAAVDAALAEAPEVAAKIRDGKRQAVGAIVGAVMKATKGRANAARVAELVLERVGTE